MFHSRLKNDKCGLSPTAHSVTPPDDDFVDEASLKLPPADGTIVPALHQAGYQGSCMSRHHLLPTTLLPASGSFCPEVRYLDMAELLGLVAVRTRMCDH